MNRTAFLLVFALSTGLGLAGLACSSSSSSGGGGDEDSGTGGDATTDGSVHKDGASDSNTGDGNIADSGGPEVMGNCSPVNGTACDIVLQNCPQGKECVAVSTSDGGFTTACNPTSVSESQPKGAACSTQRPNPCQPGLECFEGHCTPHCCMGDDSVCGMTQAGVQGTCDLQISSGAPNNTVLFMVCTYKNVCKPFQAVPCPTGESCTIEDKLGTADCLGNNGKTEGQNCMYKNDCVDGLMCLGVQGQQATCQMLCITPGQMPPFDAGTDGGPGRGGCSTGKTCSGALDPNQFPAWISLCK